MVIVIVLGYWLKWDWTGFNEHIGPNTSQYQPGKTLWDWLQLLGVLGIPVAITLGTIWFTTKQNQEANAENIDNQREIALKSYIDRMSVLILHEDLQLSNHECCMIARAQTMIVLKRLDGERKGAILQFLIETGLLLIHEEKEYPTIDLIKADFSEVIPIGVNIDHTCLREANFEKANLEKVDLRESNLRGINLRGANLRGACLVSSNFTDANLEGADLRDANLEGADLTGANLKDAILEGANIKGTCLISEQAT